MAPSGAGAGTLHTWAPASASPAGGSAPLYLDGGEGEGAAGNTWISMALFFLKCRKTPLSDLPWPPPEQGKERNILSFLSPGEEPGPREGSKWPEVTEQDRPPLPAWP